MMLRRSLKKTGFTLVEVLLATAILLMVSAACLSILQSNTKSSLATLKRIQASQYLDQIRNHLSHSPVNQLHEQYSEFPQIIDNKDFSALVKIEEPRADGSRQATITVQWPAGASNNSMSTSVTLTPA